MLDELVGFLEVFKPDTFPLVVGFKDFPDFLGLEEIELFDFGHFGLGDNRTA